MITYVSLDNNPVNDFPAFAPVTNAISACDTPSRYNTAFDVAASITESVSTIVASNVIESKSTASFAIVAVGATFVSVV